MNNTEPFDNWIRDEMDSLESTPTAFDADELWKKMQPDLREQKSLYLIYKSFFQRFAAAMLLLFALGWWRYPVLPSELAVVKAPIRTKTSAKPTDVVFNTNAKPLPKSNIIQRGLIQKNTIQPIEQDVIKPIEIALIVPKMVQQPIPANADSLLKTKVSAIKSAKPKFKIVHANELADYQRAEVAEARAKEAEKQGFVVINWKTKEVSSANNLRTYLRSKKEKSQ